uniref:28S ribosomal protein S9, mitochondrial n=1 Tax=Syphacia muris TaxID=451379 RepID=A0A0N5AZS9_9BILA
MLPTVDIHSLMAFVGLSRKICFLAARALDDDVSTFVDLLPANKQKVSRAEKRKDEYIRFGKRKDEYIRFGRK